MDKKGTITFQNGLIFAKEITSVLEGEGCVWFLLDSELCIQDVDRSGLEKWGLSRDEVCGKKIVDFLTLSRRSRCAARCRRVLQTGKPFSVPELSLAETIGQRVFRARVFKAGKGLGLVVADITEKKRLALAFKESDVRYRELVESMTEGVVTQDEQGLITHANEMFLKMTGFSKEDILGRPLSELIDQDGLDLLNRRMNETGKLRNKAVELVWRNKAGHRIFTINSLALFHDDRGHLVGSAILLTDLTERRRVENELRRSRQELRDLSRHLQSIKEEESQRIAREIHDELGQALTALKIDLSRLSPRLADSQDDRSQASEKIKSMIALLDDIIGSVQKISSELRPGLLDDLGLVPAIEWQAQEFEKRTGVKCRLSLSSGEIPLEPDCVTAVFRIVQESLTNVARHANASEVEIRVGKRARKLRLLIRDNGRGISPEEASSSNSLGLIGMRERLLPFGGTIKISGSPQRGTTLLLSLDLGKSA